MVAMSMQGQGKLDVQSRLDLMLGHNANLQTYNTQQRRFVKAQQASTNVMGFVQMNDGVTQEDLERQGVKVLKVRGNIAIASMPAEEVERISTLKEVRRVQLARKVYTKMNIARGETGVDLIHKGTGLPQAYTGKGVVTGIVDNGFDPNHINFKKEDGSTRLGYMSRIYTSSASKDGYIWENYYPKAELGEATDPYTFAIEDFETDATEDIHGTHTLGIMAGGYKGKVDYAAKKSLQQGTIVNDVNPYYGSATESEIVASCGDLMDSFIAGGIEDCISYAWYSNGTDIFGNPKKRKPCVINLSLGSNLGPHDKTSIMNQYLAEAGKESIICIAAGNEADYPICINKTFKGEDTTLQTFLKPMNEGTYNDASGSTFYNLRYGTMYLYSSDASEFEVQMVIYNKKRGTVAYRMAVSTENTDGTLWASSSSVSDAAIINPTFTKAFEGYVAIGSTVDPETGRYYAVVEYLASDNQETNADGNYMLGMIIKGKDGQRFDAYGDAQFTYFDSYGIDGWENGTRDGTISDMACADNVISVGSYNVRSSWAALDGEVYGYGEEVFPTGDITCFSSYGTQPDGTTLPHVCAPGACIVSSVNTYCVDNKSMGYSNAALQARTTDENGRTYYWHQTLGTSMSTPVVAGAIALWLEADPTLKYADVIDIIQKTAKRDKFVEAGNPAQWGAGKFDAYEGLKEVLRRQGVDAIKRTHTSKTLVTQMDGRNFQVFYPNASTMDIRIMNMAGQQVQHLSTEGEEATISLHTLPQGIYLLKVNNAKAVKIRVK